jgi:hypothetical protein
MSHLLVLSSYVFLVPAYIAFRNHLYWLSLSSFITSLVSIQYWRHPIPGFRRSLDLVVAKLSFLLYFFYGFYGMYSLLSQETYVDTNIMTILLHSMMIYGMIVCYYYANILWEYQYVEWILCHALFHILVAWEQCFIIVLLCL